MKKFNLTSSKLQHYHLKEYLQGFKFQLVIENGLCHSYISEKFILPLLVGLVPIYLGAPNVKDIPSPITKDPWYIDASRFDTIEVQISSISVSLYVLFFK